MIVRTVERSQCLEFTPRDTVVVRFRTGITRFIPFFLWHSLRGGVDVARRALHPRLPVSPGLFDYRFRLPPGLPRVFMANTVSLLPGTLSAELDEECLHVHMLDESSAFAGELGGLV